MLIAYFELTPTFSFLSVHVQTDNLALARRRMEAEEVLHGGKVRGLHVLSENPLPYSGFVRNGQSFLEGILLRLFMVPAKIPRQYSSSQGWRQSPLTGHNDPTLHLDPA